MSNRGPYAIVAGDFVPWGGMDRPNYELAWYLAERREAEVHLVSHRVASPLCRHANVTWHKVPRPFGRHTLGSPFLDAVGRKVAARVAAAGGTVVVNGGGCRWEDVNWVHYVHNGSKPGRGPESTSRRAWVRWRKTRDQRRERLVVGGSRVVVADSEMIRQHLIDHLGIEPRRVRTIYYGVDPEHFRPATAAERADARRTLALPADRPLVAFVGALGSDRRKGFDVLFDAWCRCRPRPGWDAGLIVAGVGSELAHWRGRVTERGMDADVRLVGFTTEVPRILAAADLLVSPTRFEPYGQGVHEALCCGLPAFVTRCAGVAERFPAGLDDLLLDDPPDAAQLADRLLDWRRDPEGYKQRVRPFSELLRRRTWTDMAAEFVRAVTSDEGSAALPETQTA